MPLSSSRASIAMSEWFDFDEEALAETERKDKERQEAASAAYVSQSPTPVVEPEKIEKLFINSYRHCGNEWEDVADGVGPFECPCCRAMVEPFESVEVTDG